MRILVGALLAMAIILPAAAQELQQVTGIPENETKEERKAREKKLEELRDSIAFVEAKMAIDSSYFVITADRIMLDNRINVMAPESSTNFILVQGDKAIVQLALSKAHPGLNGLGGITVDGTIGGRKIKTTKKGDIYYTFNVNGTGISAQVTITVYKNSNQSMVYISPNFHSNTLTVYGPLIPYDHYGTRNNKIFKGRSIP
ncbi:MAG TPA: DUF4251 domain-containing protein [Candidatus Avimuribaculum pullicola]|nr:DUF4251 domain-containing protein [Candidatus Avimuribaculum pullicola]